MPQRRLKAFVVEDDPTLCRAFAKTLESDVNIKAVEAHDLPDAVRLCRLEAQPVLLVDLGLPSAVGTESVSALRHELPGATLIVITGSDDKDEEAIAAGAHAVIHKGSPESYGGGLIRAVRHAVTARDASLLFGPSREGMGRQEEILKRMGQVLGTVIVLVGLSIGLARDHAAAAACMRADNAAIAQAKWAQVGTPSPGL